MVIVKYSVMSLFSVSQWITGGWEVGWEGVGGGGGGEWGRREDGEGG